MEKLVRLIGSAPSELSHEELVRKIRSRQEFVAGMLSEFRERMVGKPTRVKVTKPSKKTESSSLKALMDEMKELGVSVEDLKKIARGEG